MRNNVCSFDKDCLAKVSLFLFQEEKKVCIRYEVSNYFKTVTLYIFITLLHKRDRKKSFSYNHTSCFMHHVIVSSHREADVTESFHLSYLRVLSQGHTKTND